MQLKACPEDRGRPPCQGGRGEDRCASADPPFPPLSAPNPWLLPVGVQTRRNPRNTQAHFRASEWKAIPRVSPTFMLSQPRDSACAPEHALDSRRTKLALSKPAVSAPSHPAHLTTGDKCGVTPSPGGTGRPQTWHLTPARPALQFICLVQGQKIFSAKGQAANILGLGGQRVSVTTTQFCLCSKRAVADNTSVSKHSCVPIKLYLWIQKFEFHRLFLYHKYSPPFDCFPVI